MSKYYKAEDVIRAIEEMQNGYNGWSNTYDKAQIIGTIEELPTIEVSEDAISRADLIKELRKDAERVEMEEFANDTVWRTIGNAPSVIPSAE